MIEADFAANLARLREARWAHAALSVAVEAGILRLLERPRSLDDLAQLSGLGRPTVEELVEVLVALGAVRREGELVVASADLEIYLSSSLRGVFEAEVRSDELQTRALVDRVGAAGDDERGGWDHTDPAALISQGETGGLFGLIAECVLPALNGFGDRLAAPGAEFLDVGAGVGVIAAELCRSYPTLSGVAIEPNGAARAIAVRRLAAEGFDERVELRATPVERLAERDRFDFAFCPQPFIDPAVLPQGLDAIATALKPGGWLTVLTLQADSGEPLLDAARRLRARVWGGGHIEPAALSALLGEAGLGELRCDPPIGAFRFLHGRRPETSPQASTDRDQAIAG